MDDRAERLATVQRLLRTTELAYDLARGIHADLARLRAWESGSALTPRKYALGISYGDAEIAANRLGGLLNELRDLARLLEEEQPDAAQ